MGPGDPKSSNFSPFCDGTPKVQFFPFVGPSQINFRKVWQSQNRYIVFPSFSQLYFTNLARLCHKKLLPQIRESPLLNQENQILPGKEGDGGWKCLKHVQATFLTLNFIIPWVKEILLRPPNFQRIWRHCMPMHNKMILVHWPVIMTSSWCLTLKLFLGFILFQFHVLNENWEIISTLFECHKHSYNPK